MRRREKEEERKKEVGRKREGERTSPFIVHEYGDLHIQVHVFQHSILFEGYERAITANLN